MKMITGNLATEYGKATCDLLVGQVSGMMRKGMTGSPEWYDLLEIKRVLIGMRSKIVYGEKTGEFAPGGARRPALKPTRRGC